MITKQPATRGGRQTASARLMSAAIVELCRGQGDFEMSAVARTAGVSVGLAYHHFGSKAGLIAAAVDQFYEDLDRQVMMNSLAIPCWTLRERERTRRSVEFHYRHPLAPIILRRLRREPEVVEIEQARIAAQEAEGARNIQSGQKQGLIAQDLDPAAVAVFVLAGARALLAQALEQDQESRPSIEHLTDTIWRLVERAVSPPR